MWLEVQQVQEHQRRELTLTGPEISKRISETGLDDHIYELISLNFLEISKTTLALLDEKIGSLRSLNRLILHDNKLQTLPGMSYSIDHTSSVPLVIHWFCYCSK